MLTLKHIIPLVKQIVLYLHLLILLTALIAFLIQILP